MFLSTPALYEWFRQNVEKDVEEENLKTTNILESLQVFINPSLFRKVKRKTDRKIGKSVKSDFILAIAKHGLQAKEIMKLKDIVDP